MEPLVVVLIVVAVAAIVLFLLLRGRGRTEAGASPAASPAPVDAFRPPASTWRVSGGDAHVEFAVPLPPGDVDPVLRDLLLAEAVEVLREKRSKLPMDGVSRVHAYATRDGEPVSVGTLGLDGPGVLPPPPAPGTHPLARSHAGPDLFDDLSDIDDEPVIAPGVDSRVPSDDLPPLLTDVRLTAMQDAGLRAQGIDPAAASTADLVSGLLRIAGYSLSGGGASFTATRAGDTTYVEVVEHLPGAHPELSEKAVDEFVVRFGSSGAGHGLLFTPKYGSFQCYDRERRLSGARFVTRERFQRFVGSAALG